MRKSPGIRALFSWAARDGPAVRVPDQLTDAQSGWAGRATFQGVIQVVGLPGVGDDRVVTGRDPAGVPLHELSAAARLHRFAGLVEVGTRDRGCPSHADVV